MFLHFLHFFCIFVCAGIVVCIFFAFFVGIFLGRPLGRALGGPSQPCQSRRATAAGFGGWLGVLIDRIGLPGRREVVRSSQVANADTAEG